MARIHKFLIILIATFVFINSVWAAGENPAPVSKPADEPKQNFNLPQAPGQANVPVVNPTNPTPDQLIQLTQSDAKIEAINFTDMTNYTLGAEDVIQVDVQRHPEFSGIFPVNLEGKIQYKFAGDIEVTGLNKSDLEKKIKNVISAYIINPDITVTILDYKSKVIYVLGEVAQPGKYFMRSESMPVREALVLAGLPTLSSAMRRCRLISPDKSGKAKVKYVDVYALLYGGDLTKNIDMHAGDVLYVPATVMAKVMRVISPVAAPVVSAGAAATGTSNAKTAADVVSGSAGR